MLLILTTAVQALDGETLSRNQVTKIESAILDETRDISIYLPDDYAYSEAKYPVLYLLDGGTHLQHASGAVDYLSSRGTITDIIEVTTPELVINGLGQKNGDSNVPVYKTNLERVSKPL